MKCKQLQLYQGSCYGKNVSRAIDAPIRRAYKVRGNTGGVVKYKYILL